MSREARCPVARLGFLIHRSFYVAGKATGAGDNELYPDGWICGGQMASTTA